MTSKEIIKRLKKDNWVKVGGRGDHEKFKHPTKSGHIIAPHPRKDLRPGTLNNIFKQAGWK
ncbi:hypothetical protein SPBRAN_327 [uncultured Candidatus Thioglobus sp.]|nr:hypothetical protein SPBRAN_327 [uncultured Candidatus Thioglobus sp.]